MPTTPPPQDAVPRCGRIAWRLRGSRSGHEPREGSRKTHGSERIPMSTRIVAIAVAAAVGMALAGVTRGFGESGPIANPDTLVVLTYVDPVSLDPAYAYDTTSDGIIWPGIYETLITYDGSVLSRYVPRLATTVPTLQNGLISKDGLTYTFPVRQGVHFHDGTSWLLLTPLLGTDSTRAKGAVAVSYEDAAKAVTVEGQDVVFHLKHPYAAFLSILAAWSFVLPEK